MEIKFDSDTNETTFVNYIGGDAYSAPIIWHSKQGSSTTNNLYYLHRDYLGSILGITDADGNFEEKRHFGAWGEIVKLEDGNGNALSSFKILDRGYTGHEHLLGVGLVHMNGRLYDPVLHRFLSPDNYVQDPFNSQNFNRYGYVLNNPLKYKDPNGEFLIAALIGAAIGVITNGISNSIQKKGFFEGAGAAAIFGAIGGAASYGIGQIATNIASSLAGSSLSNVAVASFQAGSHALLGGSLSVAQGGKFGMGALSGALSSGIGSIVNGIKIGSKILNSFAKIGASGISGGVGSMIAGGNFLDGMRQGLISGGLNHGVHSGWFGPNIAAAAITQRFRHLFGPDAVALSGNLSLIAGYGGKYEDGAIALLRGKISAKNFQGFTGALGFPTASMEISITNLYYNGSVSNIKMGTFIGNYQEFNLGLDVGISVGVHSSISVISSENFVLGIGTNYGIGISPLYGIDANFQIGKTW